MDQPTLVVYGSYSSQAVASFLAHESNRPIHVLAYDSEWLDGRPDVACSQFTDFVLPEDYTRIDDFCKWFQDRWYLSDDGDLSEWDGVSLGSLVGGYGTLNALVPMLQNVMCATRAMKATRPARVSVGRGSGILFEAWKEVARHDFGIEAELLPVDPEEPADEWVFSTAPPQPSFKSNRRHPAKVLLGAIDVLLGDRGRRADNPTVLVLSKERRLHKELTKWGLDARSPTLRQLRLATLDDEHIQMALTDLAVEVADEPADVFAERRRRCHPDLSQSPDLGISPEAVARVLDPFIDDYFTRRLPQIAQLFAGARRALRGLAPTAILTRADWGTDGAVWCCAGRAEGVPVVALQREFFATEDSNSLPAVIADRILTVGPSSDAWFVRNGVPAESLIQVGDPDRKHLAVNDSTARSRWVRRALALDRRPLILFVDGHYTGSAGNDIPILFWRNLRLIKQAAHEIPTAQFVVKFHPRGAHQERQDHILCRVQLLSVDKPANLILAPLRSDAEDLLAAADVVVTDTSSMGLEAILLSTPVIYMRDRAGGHHLPPWAAAPEIVFLDAPTKLTAALQRVLTHLDDLRANPGTARQRLLEHLFAPARDANKIVYELCRGAPNGASR